MIYETYLFHEFINYKTAIVPEIIILTPAIQKKNLFKNKQHKKSFFKKGLHILNALITQMKTKHRSMIRRRERILMLNSLPKILLT
jgi:hypothetical protein